MIKLIIAFVLIISAFVSSTASLSGLYAPVVWGTVGGGAAFNLVIWLWDRRWPGAIGARPTSRYLSFGIDLAILSQITLATTQALTAVGLPSPHSPLHATPAIRELYLVLAGLLAFSTVALSVRWGDKGRGWAALLCAAVFSSVLYLRAFAVPEAGPVYGPIFGLALIAALIEPAWGARLDLPRCPMAWCGTFWAVVGLAVVFSPAPGQSLDYWLRLTVVIGLGVLVTSTVTVMTAWRVAAWGVVLTAAALPILLTVGKLLSMAVSFGGLSALAYRYHPNELGGANLIARSILGVVPLGLALLPGRPRRVLRVVLLVSSLFAILYCQSWDGFFGWLAALLVYSLLRYGKVGWQCVRGWFNSRLRRWIGITGIALFVLSLIGGCTWLAVQLNVYSFNGRLIHWHGALLTWLDHPWLGHGPGNELAYTAYANKVSLWTDTQTTWNDPLWANKTNLGASLRAHSHNLLLEIGAGSGLAGFVSFVGFLVVLFIDGLRMWRRSQGAVRLGVAACLAGLVGELVWGMLDVLWVTPPFFSFPVWGLLGLLWAAEHLGQDAPAGGDVRLGPVYNWGLLLGALGLVLLPALASASYRDGFLALQEQHWQAAAWHLERTIAYEPWKAHYHALLGQVYLAQAKPDLARTAYERANVLKQGFSPYVAQLGWLAWLQGDVEHGTRYLEQAVRDDPGELWRPGLHAELGLAYAAQGRDADAVAMFKQTLERNPELAAAFYWQPMLGTSYADESGTFKVVLSPVYRAGASPQLAKRILSHLGIGDASGRTFAYHIPTGNQLGLNDVLSAIESRQADVPQRNQALRLAAVAEAARQAGLVQRAEQACIEFTSLQPNSAYGLRVRGELYRARGRLSEAQLLLERAVQGSPGDVPSQLDLALVYLDKGQWQEAQQCLDIITRQSRVTLFHSYLFNPDLYTTRAAVLKAQDALAQAVTELAKVALVRQAPSDYLALADLYRQLEQAQLAAEQCWQAADSLIRAWPRPLAPELWEIGTCLAQAGTDQDVARGEALARAQPLIGSVLLGHVYRARGQLEQALGAYSQAAEARPDESGPHYFLAETYQALGRPEAAEAEYRRAAELNPNESLPLLGLGRMQWGLGQRESALASFRAAVKVTPGWGEAQTALGNALLATGDRAGAARHYHLAQMADGDVYEGMVDDLGARLADAEVDSPGPDYVRNAYFTIDGDRRRVLFMHPDSHISYTVHVASGEWLVFSVATAPESWSQAGDGVGFTVSVVSEGEERQIFSAYVDPKHEPANRRWHSHALDLGAFAGRTVTLRLGTSAGPGGDNRYDWAGWGNPRIEHLR